ncbi:MAG TPA: MFS transporter [Caulobacteraceae bacterium]|jgi:SHS family lactate transporter-like MFS transporter
MSLATELRSLDRHQWSAVTASFLGWTLDAFDFFLMVFMFSAIAKEFHTNVAAVAIASTLTLAARPFGALVFGMLADRFGRKPILMIDILLYSVMEFASAYAPTLTTLLILRTLFGFAMGGEWGIGASLVMESIPPKARGFLSGVLQEGYAAGFLLASLVFFFLFDRIGWRGMFMVGLVPALLIVLIRLGVKESPVFEAQRHTLPQRSLWVILGIGVVALGVSMGPALIGALDKAFMLRWVYFVDAPIALCGLWMFRKHWKMALYTVLLTTAFNFFSHGAQDLYPTFLGKQHGLNTQVTGSLTMIGNVGAIVGGLFFGAWSERLGRRYTIIIAALLSLLIIPLWAFSHTVAMLALGAFAMQVMVQGAWGVIPVHLNELAPPEARGSFPGFAYQLGNILASGCVVWQSQIAESRGGDYGFAMALVVGIVAAVIAVVTFFGPERRGISFITQVE